MTMLYNTPYKNLAGGAGGGPGAPHSAVLHEPLKFPESHEHIYLFTETSWLILLINPMIFGAYNQPSETVDA